MYELVDSVKVQEEYLDIETDAVRTHNYYEKATRGGGNIQ